MDASEGIWRIWEAFDAGEKLVACAWCGRVRIDGTWFLPARAAIAAVDSRLALSHSICDGCTARLLAHETNDAPRPEL